MKKFLSFLLVAPMLLGMLPAAISSAAATARLYNVYADGMIFQQNADAVFAGTASPGALIRAELKNASGALAASGESIAAADGTFTVSFPSPAGSFNEYTVELTARSRSGASGSATILLTVSNISDERIDIEDDYGEFTPGEEIDPIDLSDAVDFSRGETISVSGLPRGLVFNRTAKDSAGVAANTITGTPTVPGYYTLTFTAKVVSSERTDSSGRVTYVYEQAVATAFITVLPYPLLSVAVDDEAAAFGNAVSGGGNYKPGTKVTLKAKSAKGWVFAGWDGIWDVEWPESLKPSLSLVTEDSDLDVTALFMPVSDDWLTIFAPVSFGTDFDAELDLGVDVTESGYGDFIYGIVDSGSYPTVKVSGLPSGVKFSASTLLLSGKPPGKLRKGRDPYAPADEEGCLLFIHSLQREAISQRAKNISRITGSERRKLPRPLSCDPVYEAKRSLFPVRLTDTDRPGKKAAPVIAVDADKLTGHSPFRHCSCLQAQVKYILRDPFLREDFCFYILFILIHSGSSYPAGNIFHPPCHARRAAQRFSSALLISSFIS